jgi:hypothetical protein
VTFAAAVIVPDANCTILSFDRIVIALPYESLACASRLCRRLKDSVPPCGVADGDGRAVPAKPD